MHLDIPYTAQVWFFRIAPLVLPVLAFLVTRRVCRELAANEIHPLRDWIGSTVRRGEFEP